MSAHIEELTRRNESSTDFDVVAELASILSRFVIFPKNNPFGFVSSNQSELIMVKAGAIQATLQLISQDVRLSHPLDPNEVRQLRARIAASVLSFFSTQELQKLFSPSPSELWRRRRFYDQSFAYADCCLQLLAEAQGRLKYQYLGLHPESSSLVANATKEATASEDEYRPFFLAQTLALCSNKHDVMYEVWKSRG